MRDEHKKPTSSDAPEYRSTSATIIQGVAATGALAYGLGHLAEGVAKVKDSFGGAGAAAPKADSPKADK